LGKPNFDIYKLPEEACPTKLGSCSMDSMDVANLIWEMTPAVPGSPAERESTGLDEAPEVVGKARVKRRRAQRCIAGEFAKLPSSPSRSPSPAVLPACALEEATGLGKRAAEDRGTDEGNGKGPAEATGAEARPSKTLRMQVRPKKRPAMDGGSSTHNASQKTSPVKAKVERTVSVYVPFSRFQEEAQSARAHTPPVELWGEETCMKLELDFSRVDIEEEFGLELLAKVDAEMNV